MRWVLRRAALLGFCVLAACESTPKTDVDRLHNLGKAHFENGETTEALAYFERCVAAEPASFTYRLSVAKTHFLAENHEAALPELRALREERPDSPDVLYNLGILLKRMGDVDEAIDALEDFVRVERTSVPGHYNLALLYVRQGRYDDADASLRVVLEREPAHAAAYYQTYVVARSRGQREAAEQALETFETLKRHIPSERLTSGALEESPYFEIDVPVPGRSPAPPAMAPVSPQFAVVDVPPMEAAVRAIALLARVGAPPRFLFGTEDGAAWIGDSLDGSGAVRAAVSGAGTFTTADLDNDGTLDVLVAMGDGLAVWRGTDAGSLIDVTAESGVDVPAASVRVADLDHDGDLDLLVVTAGERLRVLRNNGAPDAAFPTFTDATADMGLGGAAMDVAVADFDRDMDLDVAILSGTDVRFARNLGRVRFADAGVAVSAVGSHLACADVTNDGWVDLLVSGDVVTVWRNRGSFEGDTVALPGAGSGTRACVADVDADGRADVVSAGEAGTFVHVAPLNEGPRVALDGAARSGSFLVAGDVDGDGDVDVLDVRDGVRLLRNDTRGGRVLDVALEGGRSNAFGVGAEIEARAGGFATTLLVEGPVTRIGIGSQTRLDYVRVTWPSGIVQNDVDVDVTETAIVRITEKPEPLGSCPALYAWDGKRVRFVTDVFGTTTIGFPFQGGDTMPFDDEELIALPDWAHDHGGEVLLHVTEELNEVAYVDRTELWLLEHPDTLALYPNTILRSPPFPDADVVFVARERVPVRAVDEAGRDWSDAILERDHRFATGFERLRTQFHGMTQPHSLYLTLPDGIDRSRLVLVVDGWIDWPETPQFVSMGQHDTFAMVLPTIEVKGDGEWRPVAAFGIQALKPKTVVVDLAARIPEDATELRLTSNLATHWDRLVFGERVTPDDAPRVTRAPARGDVHYRGFASLARVGDTALSLYDYDRPALAPPFVPSSGAFTRYGDVTSLVSDWDDRFVVMNAGDELTVAFDVSDLAPLRPGWRRSGFLRIGGFAKEADYHTHTAGRVEPLPYRAMSRYPYTDPDAYPESLARTVEAFNTRIVTAAR